VRIALLVVVVAVHLLVIWLFATSRRAAQEAQQEELALAWVSVPEWTPKPEDVVETSKLPAQHKEVRPAAQAPVALEPLAPEPVETPPNTTAPAPDWRAQGAITAESQAQQIVAAEDDAARRANALKAPYKPMPGPRVPGPAFGWDPAPKGRLTAIGHAAFALPISDQCAFVFVIIMPAFGCSLGPKPAANGDLFKYMHGPVKYGDWDWRVKDP
jgi:hypothetical protein